MHVGQLEHGEDGQPEDDQETVPLADVPQERPHPSQYATMNDAQVEHARRVDDDQTQQKHVVDLRVDAAQEQRHRVRVQVLSAVRPERVVALGRHDVVSRRPADVQLLGDAATGAALRVHNAERGTPGELNTDNGEEHGRYRHLSEQDDAKLRRCFNIVVFEAEPFRDELLESVDFVNARRQILVDPVKDGGHARGAAVTV